MDSYSDDYGYLLLSFRIFLPSLVKKKICNRAQNVLGLVRYHYVFFSI